MCSPSMPKFKPNPPPPPPPTEMADFIRTSGRKRKKSGLDLLRIDKASGSGVGANIPGAAA